MTEVNRFLSYLSVERAASENTLASYEIDVHKFSAWLRKPLALARRTDVQSYMCDLLAEGKSAKTASRRLACLRHFYRFLIDEEEIKADPTRNLPMPKAWKTVPRSLHLADFEKMVASLGNSWLDVRDKAILFTFFASGLRVSELCVLKLRDVDLEVGAIKVWKGKGAKDGLAPLNGPAIGVIKEYLERARPGLAVRRESPYLFLTRRGEQMTRQNVFYRIRDLAEDTLGKFISPHSLRHGFATALVEGGADIRAVQALMRHSSVDTTAIYIHIDLTYLRRMYANHPRAHFAQASN